MLVPNIKNTNLIFFHQHILISKRLNTDKMIMKDNLKETINISDENVILT